jgi:hypothetical protein
LRLEGELAAGADLAPALADDADALLGLAFGFVVFALAWKLELPHGGQWDETSATV